MTARVRRIVDSEKAEAERFQLVIASATSNLSLRIDTPGVEFLIDAAIERLKLARRLAIRRQENAK